MRIAFLLYPTAGIRPSEDTSFWIMHELQRRGHTVTHFESRHMGWDSGRLMVSLSSSRTLPAKGFVPAGRPVRSDLSEQDCVFIRKEPPFDTEYLYALQLLEGIKDRSFMINDPAGIAMANEKLLILRFPADIPDTMVTASIADARSFVRRVRGRVVVKPLDDKGGHGVFLTSSADRNLPSLMETLTRAGAQRLMLQKYLPVERHGDKRILLLNGRILGAFVRRPARDDFRANIGVGGSFARCAVTAGDRKLCARISPELERLGLYFTGIDVIGSKLTEINVTSPSGIADLITLYGRHAERDIADFVERRAGKVS